MNKRIRQEIFERFRAANPHPTTELNFNSPFELLIAVLLSAQATDVGVNKATAKLFPVAATPQARLELGLDGVMEYTKTIGLYKTKSKHIMQTCRILLEKYHGEVPADRAALEALPGVGRKTANVVLGNAFGIPGLTVDTHFGRIVRRLGLTHDKDPVKVEHALEQLIEKREWTLFSHRVIFHGRRVCHSRKAACGVCFLAKQCPSYGKVGPTEIPLAQALVKSPDREHLFHMAGVNDEN